MSLAKRCRHPVVSVNPSDDDTPEAIKLHNYYGDLIGESAPTWHSLRDHLSRTKTRERSAGACEVVQRIDLHSDGSRRCAYTLDIIPRGNREHVVPQSWWRNAANVNDLHHLFLTDHQYNSARSNHLLGFNPDDASPRKVGDCILTQRGDVPLFWPAKNLGAASRATLYILVAHGACLTSRTFSPEHLEVLVWHAVNEPVTSWEEQRNNRVQRIQGNRNPFIDFPQWAGQIQFSLALGATPHGGQESRFASRDEPHLPAPVVRTKAKRGREEGESRFGRGIKMAKAKGRASPRGPYPVSFHDAPTSPKEKKGAHKELAKAVAIRYEQRASLRLAMGEKHETKVDADLAQQLSQAVEALKPRCLTPSPPPRRRSAVAATGTSPLKQPTLSQELAAQVIPPATPPTAHWTSGLQFAMSSGAEPVVDNLSTLMCTADHPSPRKPPAVRTRTPRARSAKRDSPQATVVQSARSVKSILSGMAATKRSKKAGALLSVFPGAKKAAKGRKA